MTDTIIMVAPNGARKTRKDHASLPVSIEETVAEAAECFQAGASVIHGHVRGQEEEHVLDPGLYRELLAEMSEKVPQMLVQITTEAVGRYSPEDQVSCVKALVPQMASVSLREISANFTDVEFAGRFFAWCAESQVHVQHILYSNDELTQFFGLRERGVIPQSHRCALFVLGRYSVQFQSDPGDLDPFLGSDLAGLDWFTCAFGRREQDCVLAGVAEGGHARVGFENNLNLPDGEIAQSSAALVASLAQAIRARAGSSVATPAQTAQLLGIRSA